MLGLLGDVRLVGLKVELVAAAAELVGGVILQVSSMFSNMDGKSWEQYMGGNVSLVSKDNSYGLSLIHI